MHRASSSSSSSSSVVVLVRLSNSFGDFVHRQCHEHWKFIWTAGSKQCPLPHLTPTPHGINKLTDSTNRHIRSKKRSAGVGEEDDKVVGRRLSSPREGVDTVVHPFLSAQDLAETFMGREAYVHHRLDEG